jgi:hypothetical protein
VDRLVVNVALLVLAIVKVAMVFFAAGIPLLGGVFPFVLAQIALLLAIPGVFSFAASSHGGQLPMLAVYGAWWAAALVPILYVLMAQRRRPDGLAARSRRRLSRCRSCHSWRTCAWRTG